MENLEPQPESNLLLEILTMRMPFGIYTGSLLCHLPVAYLE